MKTSNRGLTAALLLLPWGMMVHAFRGPELGIAWSSPGKRSAYVGTCAR